jgi:hypothetical protein
MRVEPRHVGDHRLRGFLVVLAFGQVEQFAGLAQAVFQTGDAVDVLLQA